MKEQNYKNHKRLLPGFHGVAFTFSLILFIFSIYSVYTSIKLHDDLRYSILFFICSILFLMLFYYSRSFALKAQDRAIRAEENLRYFALTGNLFDKNLKTSQILALRFASEEEYLNLTEKALKANLSNEEIKKEIKNWKADYYRV